MDITINGNVTLNQEINLGDLISKMGSLTKAPKTPTPKKLREEEPIIRKEECSVFANGYALFESETGDAVMWLADCVTFTYRFVKNKASDEGDEQITIDDFSDRPWYWAVMVRGGHQVEYNNMQRKGNRKARVDLNEEDEETEKRYCWAAGARFENPEKAYTDKETIQEALTVLTDKQRQVFTMYQEEGYTQQEIADEMGITQQAVDKLLKKARAAFNREKARILATDI